MKNNNFLSVCILSILLCIQISQATAGDTLPFQKSLSLNDLPAEPTYLVINLYETQQGTVPIASQVFYPGEWDLIGDSESVALKTTIVDTSSLAGYEKLWAETEIDGMVIGSREAIDLTLPGISTPGLIESRDVGFGFPDSTVQSTAGVTPGDLSTHQANTSAHHSPLVSSADIVDGTILPEDISTDNVYFSVYGLETDGGDLKFYDAIHGIRWYSDATTQRAYIETKGTRWAFIDNLQSNRTVLYSDADGIGIGTNTPSATHAVTVPSLQVTGNLDIGYEIVSALVETEPATCYSMGDQACFKGLVHVWCPTGKKVLGGGVSAAETQQSTPIGGGLGWTCAITAEGSGRPLCWAICARLE